jgi:hypothetical protein
LHADITDLCWRGDSSMFASASIDTTVAIWRVPASTEQWHVGLRTSDMNVYTGS